MIGLNYGNLASSGVSAFSFGNALQFDATNDFINRTSSLDLLNGTCTFGFWFKRLGVCSQGIKSSNVSTFYAGTLGNTNGFRFRWTGAELNFTYSSGWGIGNWHCIIFSKTTSNIKIFVNGSEEVNQAYSMSDFGTGRELRLTRSFGAGGFVADQFFIVPSVEITSTEATALYNGGDGAYVADTIGTPSMLINFNQNSPDATATDESGNGNDFTLNNFDTSTCWIAH